MHKAMVEWFDIPKPRIAVCGVNPHASENGQFGDEEERIISPAILMARDQGIDVTRALSAGHDFPEGRGMGISMRSSRCITIRG